MLADKYMQELVDLFEAIAGKGKRFVTKEAWLSYERSQLSFVGAIQSCMNSSTEDQDILHWRMDLCKAICSAFDLIKDGQISFAEFVTAAVAFAAVGTHLSHHRPLVGTLTVLRHTCRLKKTALPMPMRM